MSAELRPTSRWNLPRARHQARNSHRRRRLIAVGLLVGLSIWLSPGAQAGTGPTTAPAQRVLFAVPFGNETGEDQYDPAAAAMGDVLAAMLARNDRVRIVERRQLDDLSAEQARSLQGLTPDRYALRAGQLLEADTVLSGRVYLVQGKLTVVAQAADIATQRVVASQPFSFRPEDLPEAALHVAEQLGTKLSLPLPAIDLSQVDTMSIANLHFAKALSHYYAGNMDEALMQLMRTVDLDPDFAEARYLSGWCYQRLGQNDHAVIEWDAFIRQRPDQAARVERPLAAARRQAPTTRNSGGR